MTDYEYGTAPWYSRREEIKKVIIEDGVTNIGDKAFYECNNLTSVEIPNSVTSIGSFTFAKCRSLISVTIPNSVTSIGDYAFFYCEDLTSVTIPNSVTSIGLGAFGCSGLTSIEIPNSVTSIGRYAFNGCSGLTSVTIPNSVTSIGDAAFFGCDALTSVEIPNSVTSIGDYAFSYTVLTSVTIPNSVTSIGNHAFFSCEHLTSITFKGSTPPAFENNVFYNVNKSIPVYVPSINIEAYKNVLGDDFPNIQANPKQLFLNNKEAYTQNSQADGVDVSYTRDFSTNWESIYLPFSLEYKDWKDDFEVARINAVRQYDTNDDGDIDETVLEFVKMKSGSVIYPNTPYLIKSKNSGKKTISVENTTLYESKTNSIECSTTTEQFTFIGLYKKPSFSFYSQTFISKYVMDEGLLSELTAQSNIGPYRWYMTRENRKSAYGINNNNTAKEISIRVVGEETTGIANIQHASPNTQTYDLNGRKVNENNLKPGMYVKNGRKFVIK